MTKDTETSSISRDDVGSLRSLLGVDEETELKEFKPCVFFKPYLGWLTILLEDVATRSLILESNPNVELLLHPYEDKIVGLRVANINAEPNMVRILKYLQPHVKG